MFGLPDTHPTDGRRVREALMAAAGRVRRTFLRHIQPSDRFVPGGMTNPVRGFLHGTAAVVSVLGATLLTVLTPR